MFKSKREEVNEIGANCIMSSLGKYYYGGEIKDILEGGLMNA
jgi:hypothetical protein